MFNYSASRISYLASLIILIASCSVTKQISRSAKELVINDSSLLAAHVGISVYEPANNKYWFNYQGDKYFVPASNTKIPTCYAAMKYLGDSLVGLKYSIFKNENGAFYFVKPTADPTFLHPDFKKQPIYFFLSDTSKKLLWKYVKTEFNRWGSGWSWNDYHESYMAERSEFPIYGNLVKVIQKDYDYYAIPKFFNEKLNLGSGFKKPIERPIDENEFIFDTIPVNRELVLPFVTSNVILDLIRDTVNNKFNGIRPHYPLGNNLEYSVLHSQPTDSLLKPMMHRSNNFFAEQTLLMVSNELLGVMNDEKIIDTLLKTDFKDLPQKPRWADGSGLSRYNLFTPQDFVFILNKMKNEFPMERIKEILPTGGEGTLSNYYKPDSNYIFAKTGTLSDVVALSGYLYTKKNKLLIFSVLINNHRASATAVRRAVEKFLQRLRNQY